MKLTKDDLIRVWLSNSYREIWSNSYSLSIFQDYLYLRLDSGKMLILNWKKINCDSVNIHN